MENEGERSLGKERGESGSFEIPDGAETLLCNWEGNLVQAPSFLDGNLVVFIKMINISTL